ncbi:unnamed protein product [Macrosiphum euphorbiae]|uniref:Ankyrin repeat-containing domain n=2 Tax=Macrosiphum euphorbiae TaxID=13131 RepID=A0AAV0WZN6_9HEMI|nr:unnamed protein product [Macrosiphum euphorbiae]
MELIPLNCSKETSTMAADDKTTYTLPSLSLTAFNACIQMYRKKYYEKEVPIVDIQVCCEALFDIMKLNSEDGRFNLLGDRQSMFGKVQDKIIMENICEEAASNGHIECMKFARAIGVPWFDTNVTGESACDRAITSGNLDCLIYAIDNGCPANEETCGWAAWVGQLECLKYLHNNRIPWHPRTCTFAANRGHMNCLKYAYENGCSFDRLAYTFAVLGKHSDCIQYVYNRTTHRGFL